MDSKRKERDEQNATSEGSLRKPYNTPMVQIYGDMREITQGMMGGALADGGPGNNNMTN